MNEFRFDSERLGFSFVGYKNSDCPACSTKSEPIASLPFKSDMVRVYGLRNDMQPSKYELSGTRYKSSAAHGYQELLVENTQHADRIKEYSVEDINELLLIMLKRVADISQHSVGENVVLIRKIGGHGATELSVLPIPNRMVKTCFECGDAANTCDREIMATENLVVFVPFAPRFEKEIEILPKKHVSLEQMDGVLIFDIAGAIKNLLPILENSVHSLVLIEDSGKHTKIFVIKGEVDVYTLLGISKIETKPENYAKELREKTKV